MKYKVITNQKDAPWTLAQSWTPHSAEQAFQWAREAIDRGETAVVLRDGERIDFGGSTDIGRSRT